VREGVLGHVVPLLLGYDTTHQEGQAGQPAFDFGGNSVERGPAFLGLGVERSNMQVCTPPPPSIPVSLI